MNASQYRRAEKIIRKLINEDPAPKSLHGRILGLLADLMEAYEEKKYKIKYIK